MTKNELKYYEKLKQKKFRDEENKFLIEGVHLIEECLKSESYKDNLEKIFVRENFSNSSSIEFIRSVNHYADIVIIDDIRFSKLTETVTSQGIIGVVSKPESSDKKTFVKEKGAVVVAAENINDPGNLGTIIRTCHWFGADELIISKNSADIFNSKVIRASQGSVFFVEIKTDADLENDLKEFKTADYEILVTDLKSQKSISEMDFSKEKNYVIVLGNESSGVSGIIKENKDYTKVKIDGFSGCESLNVSVTAGIILYEITKK